MGKSGEIAIAAAIMVPFLMVYLLGVALQRCHERARKRDLPPFFSIEALGEAVPGAVELISALTVIFGALARSSSEDSAFHSLSILVSAGYLAFRGGYTYRKTFVDMFRGPRRPAH
ncbi:hypothetical protein [Roseateles chitinivorans]|uniref:hypothetical protein n=1 Tax=Roseateles chitinivorans TaxID=2917965 RepID=UPI003D66E3D6